MPWHGVGVIAVVGLFVGQLVAAPSAGAAGFTVNHIGSGSDVAIDGVCDADASADVDCTLTAAIEEANATVAVDGIGFQKSSDSGGDPDDRAFVNGKPPEAVTIVGPLPTITSGLSIAAGNCAPDLPMIDDPPTPCAIAPPLDINSSGAVIIVGLAFGTSGTALDVNIVGDPPDPEFKLLNSWFGIDTVGNPLVPPGTAVLLREETQSAEIGGDPTTGPNLFARHNDTAVDILGADNTVISNNVFGVLPDGTFARVDEELNRNGDSIEVTGNSAPNPDDPATGTVIGGSLTGLAATPACDGVCNLLLSAGRAHNGIPDASSAAIELGGESAQGEIPADGVQILGNQIGTGDMVGVGSSVGNEDGNHKPNNAAGVSIGNATNVTIGGPAAGDEDRNLFGGDSVKSLSGASALLIQNNVGFSAVDLQGSGEVLDNRFNVANNTQPTLQLSNTAAPNFAVQGNLIGIATNGNGTSTGPLGIKLLGSANGNAIGGLAPGDGNRIADFAPGAPNMTGIQIAGDNNVVSGNTIGVDANGVARKLINGIELITDADGNTIGGSTAASENLISNVIDDAIVVTNANSDGNEILRNRGAANGDADGDLFIDLGDDGLGNLGEPDGPNGGAQAPTTTTVSATEVAGTAAPGATVRLFKKANASAGELEGFLAETTASGAGAWTTTFPAQVHGTRFAATSTVAASTSEVSPSVALDADPPKTTITKGPKGRTTDRTPKFRFISDEVGSTFECKLKGGFKDCKSPKRYRKLAFGRYKFKVRATDAATNTDPTPVTRKFKVVKR